MPSLSMMLPYPVRYAILEGEAWKPAKNGRYVLCGDAGSMVEDTAPILKIRSIHEAGE